MHIRRLQIEEIFNIQVSNERGINEVSLVAAVQSLAFNCPSIIVAVKNNDSVKQCMDDAVRIITDLNYTPVIIDQNRIKIKEYQPSITFDPVFEKYEGSEFLTMSVLINEVLS